MLSRNLNLLYKSSNMENSTMFRWSVFYELGMACDNVEERAELRQAIMEYGLYGKEPPQKFKRDFINIRFILDKSKKISYLRSETWKKWWAKQWNQNAVKNFENYQKQAKQAKTNKTSETYSLSNSNSISSNNKIQYLEYVYLSNIEYKKLIEWYWKSVIDKMIEKLNNWIWENPKEKKRQKKSHYHTLLNWLDKDWIKKLTPKSDNESWVYENLRDQDVYLQELIKWKQK